MQKLIYFLLIFPLFLLQAQTPQENYVKTTIYKVPVPEGFVPEPDPGSQNISVTYYDGLGRPKQQIAHRQSGNGKDIITHMEYDDIGRQTKVYLPYERDASTLLIDNNAHTNTFDFYNTPYYQNTLNPYSECKKRT